MQELPSEIEIKEALMTLRPHKAPGPDGFNAKIVQDNWDAFGSALTAEVLSFFQTGVIKSSVARSNIILIPKSEDANLVAHAIQTNISL